MDEFPHMMNDLPRRTGRAAHGDLKPARHRIAGDAWRPLWWRMMFSENRFPPFGVMR
jgi:hypothetical protein